MKRVLASWLVACFAFPSPSRADGALTAEPAAATPRTFDVKATVVSVDPTRRQLTYIDNASGASSSALLGDKAAAEIQRLKSGQRVTLRCRVDPSSPTPVVESIHKKSHKKWIILGLIAIAVAAFIGSVSSEPPL